MPSRSSDSDKPKGKKNAGSSKKISQIQQPHDDVPIKINVRSEYDPLKIVLVHEPNLEIDRLTPENKKQLLFEDIPYLPKMRQEHQNFVKLLEAEGVRVLRLSDLLLDVLQDESVRNKIMTLACAPCSMLSLSDLILDKFPTPQEIRDILLGGITASELEERSGEHFGLPDQYEKTTKRLGRRLGPPTDYDDPFLLEPIPNAYFSRDPAAAIGNYVVSCKMHYLPRVRESIIVREIFRHHPLLKKNRLIYGKTAAEDRPYTIEGGDIIVLSSKAIAVGCSERTRSQSVRILAENLFRKGLVQRVYEVHIPADRAYMHLDTVFTVVDEGLVVAYPDVMSDVMVIGRYEPYVIFGNEIVAHSIDENRNFNTILQEEFNGRLEVIHTGNNNRRYAAREQQADGTNVFALRPSTVITYDRNTHTNQALTAAGVTVLEIEGSELVRGLGGPRCMTMPLLREKEGVDAAIRN